MDAARILLISIVSSKLLYRRQLELIWFSLVQYHHLIIGGSATFVFLVSFLLQPGVAEAAGIAGQGARLVGRWHVCRDGSSDAALRVEIVLSASAASTDKSLILILEFLKLPPFVLLEILRARHERLVPPLGLHHRHLIVHVRQRCVLLLLKLIVTNL